MTEITTSALLAELHKSAGIVTEVVAKLDDAAVKAPSELPGWSRGHVLAHIAGIANAMARQLEYAARGETVDIYDGGYEGRTKAIELAAGRGIAEHRDATEAALGRALRAFDGLVESGWNTRISFRNGTVLDGGLALWRELVIHATDLGTGRGPETLEPAVLRASFRLPLGQSPGRSEVRSATTGPAPDCHRLGAAIGRHQRHDHGHRRMARRPDAYPGELAGFC
ncbi:maleylpyruvate isomerase family mycothiol-dependent enzyme [Arthrobacter sp. NA-172]|uniref:maleylpyruvate isomerase family mycothiol-dependent enzyme n=1 Tax=Arthrobacter sp. NA-172 TaxID=3367524 RepID=UPI0037551973